MYCDYGKTRKLGDGLEPKAVREPQEVKEHRVTQKEINKTVYSFF